MVLGSEILSIEKKLIAELESRGLKGTGSRIRNTEQHSMQFAHQDLIFDGPFPHHNLDTDTVI
jgi:hypothetical protein